MVVVVLVSETNPVLTVQTTSWLCERQSGCRAMRFPHHIAFARFLHLAVAGQNYSPWWIADIAAAQGAVSAGGGGSGG